jgi:hypothetical protein
MTTERILEGHKDKCSDCNLSFSNCQVCASNGFVDEKVVFKFEGLRAEYEDGFIFKFTVYNYLNRKRIHHHKSSIVLEVNPSICGQDAEERL